MSSYIKTEYAVPPCETGARLFDFFKNLLHCPFKVDKRTGAGDWRGRAEKEWVPRGRWGPELMLSISCSIWAAAWRVTITDSWLICLQYRQPRTVYTVQYYGRAVSGTQEAKYVERWPNTTFAWAGWSRFDIPVDRYGGAHSQLICTSMTLGSSTCHQASQQGNTYWAKYQKADRASTLITLWAGQQLGQYWFIIEYIAP